MPVLKIFKNQVIAASPQPNTVRYRYTGCPPAHTGISGNPKINFEKPISCVYICNQSASYFDITLQLHKMKELDIWLARFRKIMEERFQRLDQLLYFLKNKKK